MSKVKPALSARSDFAVAIATIHRPIFAGLERYFRIPAAIGTDYGEHLALGLIAVAIVTVSEALRLPGLPAFMTAFGLVSITSGLVKLLICSAVCERNATIGTLE